MFKSKAVQKIEEERKFLRLYHEKEITALNISRLVEFTANQYSTSSQGYTQSTTLRSGAALDKELKDLYQALRKSTFLKHFAYHSSQELGKVQMMLLRK